MRMTANDAPMHIGEVFREMLEAKPVTVTLPGPIRSKKELQARVQARPGIGLCDNCFNRHQRAAKREARA